ncbi:MAG: carbon-nitrogen hydrolase family protein [Gammaproteobacteria bacterium]
MSVAAVIQLASGPNVEANLHETERLIGEAVGAGAQLIVLPENFALMGMTEMDKVKVREHPRAGRIQGFLSRQAKNSGVWIVGGTVPLECPDPRKVYSACLLFDDKGEQVARYDKIHLFDVKLPASGESYNESATIMSGDRVVVCPTPFGKMGLAVGYDLRFPELFRRMLDDGVELVALPSTYTALTGKAHWESLIRARAIENLTFVMAAAQGGYHVNGRETHGDSMIVDPWGHVMERRDHGPGVVMAELSHAQLESTRRNFPTIKHRRLSPEVA